MSIIFLVPRITLHLTDIFYFIALLPVSILRLKIQPTDNGVSYDLTKIQYDTPYISILRDLAPRVCDYSPRMVAHRLGPPTIDQRVKTLLRMPVLPPYYRPNLRASPVTEKNVSFNSYYVSVKS